MKVPVTVRFVSGREETNPDDVHGMYASEGIVTALEPVEAVIVPDSVFRSHLESTPRVAVMA